MAISRVEENIADFNKLSFEVLNSTSYNEGKVSTEESNSKLSQNERFDESSNLLLVFYNG